MKLSWYLPISWTEYISAPLDIRTYWFKELNDIKREMNSQGGGSLSGQSRADKRLGIE